MNKKEETLAEINECLEILKDYNTFFHLWSEDKGIATLAKINQILHRIKFFIDITILKKIKPINEKPLCATQLTGKFVKVRPCNKKYSNKTYLGIMIGELALTQSICIEDDALTPKLFRYNPAILIPELNEIVYGVESWWGVVESESDLKEISDIDINNIWYVKALSQLQNHEANQA